MPTLESTWYDDVHKKVAQLKMTKHAREHLQFLVKHCKGSVLDLGCGIGRLADRIDHNEYLGVDFSLFAVRYASEHTTNKNARFVHGDLSEFLPDHPYDTVVLSEVLEHIDHPEQLTRLAQECCLHNLIVTLPIHMPIKCHVKGIWSEQDIVKLFGGKPTLLEKGCATPTNRLLHWHLVYKK